MCGIYMGDPLAQVSTWICLKAWKTNPHSEWSVDNIGASFGASSS